MKNVQKPFNVNQIPCALLRHEEEGTKLWSLMAAKGNDLTLYKTIKFLSNVKIIYKRQDSCHTQHIQSIPWCKFGNWSWCYACCDRDNNCNNIIQ